MKLLKGVGNFFALDIGTNAVRVVQLDKAGNDAWSLKAYGYAGIDSKITAADSPEARQKLGEVILTAVGQSGIKATDVVIGLSAGKTFTTVVDVPTMPEPELKGTMKYQIERYIPSSINETKVDWKLLGQSLHDPKQQEVLLTSTAITYAEDQLEFIEGLGFNVIAAEPDPIAMIRALLPAGVTDARLIIDMGETSTNLAITYGDTPRLVRTIPIGLSTLLKAIVQNLNVQEDQARQFVLKFGLAPDRLDGQVLRALEATLENFVGELTKSTKFFQTRYPNVSVGGILISGFTASIPRFNEYIASKMNIAVTPANPWQKVRVSQTDQQQLLPIMNEFATVVGLAQRTEQ